MKASDPETILEAMRDFFKAWRSLEFPGMREVYIPVSAMGGIDEEGEASFDGRFNALEMARHISDAINGTPRARFTELSSELIKEGAEEIALTPFQKKWEREGRWISGDRILSKIVTHLQGKSLVAKGDIGRSAVDISLPLPEVRDEISGGMVSIYWMVPEELRPIFEDCLREIRDSRSSDIAEVSDRFMRQPMTPLVIQQINNELARMEAEREYRGDAPLLWRIAADVFGLPPVMALARS